MIGLGCDHGGLELKKTVMEYLDSKGIEYKDFGTYTSDSCDYPVYGKAVAHAVADGQCDKGIIICGTGIGISIAANKVKGIRCARVLNEDDAYKARNHNGANVIAFGARVVGVELAKMILDEFFGAEFEGGRHQARVDMIHRIEADYSK